MLYDLILKNRSYRRFYEDVHISDDTLKYFINLARLSASGRNLQPLKYIISNEKAQNAKIFETLAWAGYLTDWAGPEAGERPSAYIVMLIDKNLTASTPAHDEGIAAQSILLGAIEKGLGGCIIASVKKKELAAALNLTAQYEIALVIAIGKPKENVEICEVKNGDIKYYRNANGTHFVPKRSLNEIILNVKK